MATSISAGTLLAFAVWDGADTNGDGLADVRLEYEYNDQGRIVRANCVIPTNQNHANIQADFDKLVPEFMGEGEDVLRQNMEMLVRAYDPCISCSVHVVRDDD